MKADRMRPAKECSRHGDPHACHPLLYSLSIEQVSFIDEILVHYQNLLMQQGYFEYLSEVLPFGEPILRRL
jgi:hypothetical protein